eukprot:CAMPEP_0194260590 /NCGR_PEP_ID=MMETSP0158-20130606/45589_1 /TAXON_ID=33649 /ORGANISM="Thalassionema nitzschioides, Strain L26-B" /LENGTH=660 /DNA_ID=CAMNT_0039000685 /DNA_START=117 /DNA_END=2099 /DNA_ORIENTATION=+
MFQRRRSLFVLVATTVTAFIPLPSRRYHHVTNLSAGPDEAFQRSLLEARLRSEGRLAPEKLPPETSGVFLDSMEVEQLALKLEQENVEEALAAQEAEAKDNGLPMGWEEMIDPQSGRTFYVDHANQFSSWTKPTMGGQEAEAKAAEEAAAAAELAAKQEAEARAAEEAAAAAELAAKQEAEAKAAEEAAAAAELAAKQEAEAKAAEEAAAAAELAAKQEAEAKAAEEAAAAELAAKQEAETKAAEEEAAAAELAAKQEAEVKAAEEAAAAAELAAKQEAEAKAAEEAAAAAELAAKQEAEVKAAEEAAAAAELAAKQEAEAKAAEEAAAAAELAAEQEAEAKAAEEAAAELAAKQEAEAKAAEEKAAAELSVEQEREAVAEKVRAEIAAKKDAEKRAAEEKRASTRKELDALVSRNQELKKRVRTFAERIKNISWRNILPSSETLSSVTTAIKEFSPKETAVNIKSREESNTELVGVFAAGATNIVIDGLGTGVELAGAVRSDDELKSVVGDALDTSGDAFSALVDDVKKTESVSVESVKRQAELALCALDSVGSAAFASLCAVVGYSQEGSPVAESASKATKGLFIATSAAVALGLRGFDVVAKQYGNVANEAKGAVKLAEELDKDVFFAVDAEEKKIEAVNDAEEEAPAPSQETGTEK